MNIENKDTYKNIPLQSLGLSTQTTNALLRGGIRDLHQLIENFDEAIKLRNIGEKGISELTEFLDKY